MPHFKYVVFTEPKAGQDAAYNDWYDNIHLAEVIAVEGFVAAQRFKTSMWRATPRGQPLSGDL